MSAHALPSPDTFLSGETGHVAGVRRTLTRRLGDRLLDLRLRPALPRIDRMAAELGRRRVHVLAVYRPGMRELPAALRELRASRHDVRVAAGALGEPHPELADVTVASDLAGGKFQNLNELVAASPPQADWLLVVDDDVALPERFLDRFLALAEGFGFDLAQPAQTLMSHAAWRVTRRRAGALARATRFVEIGPVTAFSRRAADELVPFPDLRYGWGLDLHWAAVAAERGWRLGIVDATPARHESAPVGSSYAPEAAIAEAQRFLAGRPYLESGEAGATLAVHRRLPERA